MTHFEVPGYPQLAIQAGIEGRVWIRVRVNEGGAASDPEVLESSGHSIIDEPALSAATKCRYIAGKYQADNVSVRVIYAVDFLLPVH